MNEILSFTYMFLHSVLILLCVLGVLHPKYLDNLFQCLGMSVIGIGSLLEVYSIYFGVDTQRGQFIFSLGCVSYGLGTAYKHYSFSKNPEYQSCTQIVEAKRKLKELTRLGHH